MDSCIFEKIIKGEIPAAKVWEDENFLAFLSIAPINPGHTLVIPKKHIEYVFDLDPTDYTQLMIACRPIADAIKKAFNPKTGKVGILVEGTGVPHVHVHLIPVNNNGDINFSRARHDVSFEELQENAEKIKSSLEAS